MKVFVSSRMGHLLERKAAIDAIHHAGQAPRYIETEEFHDEVSKLREIMDTMLDHAEAFVGIYLPDFGKVQQELDGQQPIIFELRGMVERLLHAGLGDQIPSRILLLCTHGLSHSDRSQLAGIFSSLPESQRPPMIHVQDYTDVCSEVFEFARKLKDHEPDHGKEVQRYTLDIEYTGLDQPGILKDLSEYLFTRHGVNVESVFGSAQGERASIQLTVAWDHGPHRVLSRKELEASLNGLWSGLSRKAGEQEDPIRVFETLPDKETQEFGYVEVRSIDAPGQLNTVCKALDELELNMQQIHLAPAPSEFPGQTVISIKIPLDRHSERMSRRAKFLKLESKLRALVGVQALSTRYSGRIGGQSRGIGGEESPEQAMEA